MQSETFQLLIDGLPYRVTAKPFEFNEGIRCTVNYNGSLDFFFASDSSAKLYRAIDNDGPEVPSGVEIAISRKLEKMNS